MKTLIKTLFSVVVCASVHAQVITQNIFDNFTGTKGVIINSAVDKNHNIYLLTVSGNLFKRDYQTGIWFNYPTSLGPLTINPNRMCVDTADNNLWVIGRDGLFRINLLNNQMNLVTAQAIPNLPTQITAIAYVNNSVCIFSSTNFIVYKNNEWKTYSTVLQGVNITYIRNIVGDGNNTIWMATPTGIREIVNNTFARVINRSNSVLPYNNITSISYQHNQLWISADSLAIKFSAIMHGSNSNNLSFFNNASPGLSSGYFHHTQSTIKLFSNWASYLNKQSLLIK